MYDWKPVSIDTIGEHVGKAILLITEEGRYQGGLARYSHQGIEIEINEGQVLHLENDVLKQECLLYVINV